MAVQLSNGDVIATGNVTAVGSVGGAEVKVPTEDALKVGNTNLHALLDAKQGVINVNGILKCDGSGNITAATAGTDYITSHQDISGKANVSDFSLPSGGGAPSAQYVSSLFSGANSSLTNTIDSKISAKVQNLDPDTASLADLINALKGNN